MNWKCHVHADFYSDYLTLRLWQRAADGATKIAQGIDWKPAKAVEFVPDDVCLMRDSSDQVNDMLRAIMTAAWTLGIRPDGFEDHTNELAAVRYHLEDMRILAKVKK